MAKILASVRRKMLAVGLVAVLDGIDDQGQLRPDSAFGLR
jgi:hypothetical protein